MRNSAWTENARARIRAEFLLTNLENKLAFQNVPPFILAGMFMKSRPVRRCRSFENNQLPGGVGPRNLVVVGSVPLSSIGSPRREAPRATLNPFCVRAELPCDSASCDFRTAECPANAAALRIVLRLGIADYRRRFNNNG